MKLIAQEKMRIDKYLMTELSYTRSKIQRMIDSENILVNGKIVKNSYSLKVGDEITIDEDYTEEIEVTPEKIPLDIYYEDDYLLVINKLSGMVVHPAAGNYEKTLVNALM